MKIKSRLVLASILGLSLIGLPDVKASELNSPPLEEDLVYYSSEDFYTNLLNYTTQDQIDFYKDIYAQTFSESEIQAFSDSETQAALDGPSRAAVELTYDEYFSKVEWITRNGVVSLSITPKSTLTNVNNANALMARAFHSFSLLEKKFKSDSRWKNGGSLSAQYHCHVLAAGAAKTPWNLEPHRTETGLWKVIKGKCNPA